jgi:hypothetical protein
VLVDAYTLELWHGRHLERTRKFPTHDQVCINVRRRIYLYDMGVIYLDQSSNLRPVLPRSQIRKGARDPVEIITHFRPHKILT